MASLPAERDASDPILPDRIWHHWVHEEWAERLYFWRMGFWPTYLRDTARAGIKAAAVECGVKSIAVYEMFGVYDLLIRAWLPGTCSASQFQDQLLKELLPHGLNLCEPFAVEYPLVHWAFKSSPSHLAIKQLRRDSHLVDKFEAGTLSSSQVESLRGQHLLAIPEYTNRDRPGIKFALIVGGESGRVLSADERSQFERHVVEIVDAAVAIPQRSIYVGSGFGHFVILGRVGYDEFHELQHKLVAKLQAAPLRERFSSMTTTHVSGQRGLLMFDEQLSEGVPQPEPANETSVGDPAALRPGDIFANRFEVKKRLGTGGFGSVYLVRDPMEGVDRALKVFETTADRAAARELAMLRRVQHPNVVTMIWGDRDPKTRAWYLVTEYVEGEPLESYVRGDKRRLAEREAIEIAVDLLAALQALHPEDDKIQELKARSAEGLLDEDGYYELRRLSESGVVHRDVKPSNIMLTETGEVKLIDFNIASPSGSPIVTRSGTEPYRPPGYEVSGNLKWDPQVDLYAVGVVLYEMLCDGHRPYEDEADELIEATAHRPDLDPRLAEIVRAACSVPLGFRTAREMRDSLLAVLNSAPISDPSQAVAAEEPS